MQRKTPNIKAHLTFILYSLKKNHKTKNKQKLTKTQSQYLPTAGWEEFKRELKLINRMLKCLCVNASVLCDSS